MRADSSLFPALSLAVFAGGLWLALSVLLNLSDDQRRLERKADTLGTLRAMAGQQEGSDASRSPVEQVADAGLPPMEETLRGHLPDVEFALSREEDQPLDADWSIEQRRVILPDIELNQLSGLLQDLESARPPWTVEELTVTAVDRGPGYGRVSLLLHGLARRTGDGGTR